ncbi:MAG TPA: Ig-like domain-containing protein [Mycobacteriales bacterium]|nr:Ig-like domain-containing protein [Mycobacteriales bacterium]
MSSSSRGFRLAGTRTSAVAVLTTVIATTASVVAATPASALTSAASIRFDTTSLNTNQQSGTPATLNVDYTEGTANGADRPIRMIIFTGPDSASAPNATGALCDATPTGGTTTCSITNTTPGTDTVEAYADNNSDGTFDAGDVISAPTNVIFSGKPFAVSIAPSSSRSTAGTCVLYTLHATDSLGQPVDDRTFTITVSETLTVPANPDTISFYNIPPNMTMPDCETPLQTSVAASPATGTEPSLPTGPDGNIVFGVSAHAPGTGTISAVADDVAPAPAGSVHTSASTTWTAGGADGVTTLTITPPSSVTQYVGTTASYPVTATDHDGDPVQGVTVYQETDTASPDSIPLTPALTPCGVTDHLGQVTCTVTNGGTAGTDSLTFWVNYDSSAPGPHTPGPDPDEAQARATAIFRTAPVPTSESLTCVDQLATDKNVATSLCALPTTQHSVTFTETLTDLGAPVVGAVVQFHVPSATLGGSATATVPDAFVTTDSTGTAAFTVSDPNAANGDFVNVRAFLGTHQLNSAEADWQTPVAHTLTLTPPLQSVTKGSQVTVVAQVSDQFGNPWTAADTISYNTGGPDSAAIGATGVSVPTNGTGSITISYPSSASAVGEDDIFASDANGANGSAQVEFLTGPASAATVTVDTTGNGSSITCPSTGTPQNINLAIGTANTPVCVLVKNANGEVLAGKTVTFTVDIGKIAGSAPVPAASTATYVTTTNIHGIATAFVNSTKSGTQTVTATADSASGSGTLTYALPTVDKARNIVVSPTSATITAGGQQKFTWTVTDQFTNPVAGVTIDYTQTGPGLPGGASSGVLLTAPDGTASLVLNTSSTDNGAGSVVGTIVQPSPPTPVNQCGDAANVPTTVTTAGNCTAAATYTVVTASAPTTLTLHIASGIKKGHRETVTATVKHSDGSPAANQVIRFLVTGANGLIGSSVSNAAGVATFSYAATHAGTDAISAYDDINDDQVQESNEPGHHSKAVIVGVTDRPTIHLTSAHGTVTVHVVTHPAMPNVLVTYYVRRYGAYHRIGTSRAGTRGRALKVFFFPKGVVRHFKARVNTKQGITGAKTVSKAITVK